MIDFTIVFLKEYSIWCKTLRPLLEKELGHELNEDDAILAWMEAVKQYEDRRDNKANP